MSEWAGSEGQVSVTRNCSLQSGVLSPDSTVPPSCCSATPNELVRKLHYLSLAVAGKNRTMPGSQRRSFCVCGQYCAIPIPWLPWGTN